MFWCLGWNESNSALTCKMTLETATSGWSCWQDEDYIGRCSRITRRTHPLQMAARSFVRLLMKYKRQLSQPLPSWGPWPAVCKVHHQRQKWWAQLLLGLVCGGLGIVGYSWIYIRYSWYSTNISSTFHPFEHKLAKWYLNISLPKLRLQRKL